MLCIYCDTSDLHLIPGFLPSPNKSITTLNPPATMSVSIWTALAAVALAMVATLSLTLRPARQRLRRTIPSPRQTLIPKLSPKQAAALPYPPDLLPGARDVATPYGKMRAYEWGPRDGEKVLFIHGDTTPAPMLGPVAHDLVKRGCRVMMFGISMSVNGQWQVF